MPPKNRTPRSGPSSFRTGSHATKPRLDQELIDDKKFQQKLEAKQFTVLTKLVRKTSFNLKAGWSEYHNRYAGFVRSSLAMVTHPSNFSPLNSV
jgi:hypothetical protein